MEHEIINNGDFVSLKSLAFKYKMSEIIANIIVREYLDIPYIATGVDIYIPIKYVDDIISAYKQLYGIDNA